jgi:hypothetical protein
MFFSSTTVIFSEQVLVYYYYYYTSFPFLLHPRHVSKNTDFLSVPRAVQTNHLITQGKNGLFSARNWPDHQGIRITDIRTTEGIVYFYIRTVTNTLARPNDKNLLWTGKYSALSSYKMWGGSFVHKTKLNKPVTRKATTDLSTLLQLAINAVRMNWANSTDAAWDHKKKKKKKKGNLLSIGKRHNTLRPVACFPPHYSMCACACVCVCVFQWIGLRLNNRAINNCRHLEGGGARAVVGNEPKAAARLG